MTTIRKIVVLGSGTMGSGAAAVFAAAGFSVTLVARAIDKAEAARTRAWRLAKREVPIALATFDQLEDAVAGAQLVFEAVAESIAIKRSVFARIDLVRDPGTIAATVSSGLSIGALCLDRSDDFVRHFLGAHLFNPPTAIRGCELIPHAGTDRAVVATMRTLLESMLQRVVVECADTPAFAGNRIGFKLLNEIAQLAAEHGVAYMDQLVGPHTGRALSPLATIDLVGWDVHKAIVDNLHANTCDEAHACFELPAYIQRGIDAGRLGRKTRERGGFFRVDGSGDRAVHFVLDPATGTYRPLVQPPMPAFVERMRAAIRDDRTAEALDVLVSADGDDAARLRRIVLGYISYGLNRVGEVVAHARDVDRIMGFGFAWAPPSLLVDAIGAPRTVRLLDRAGLPVPPVIAEAAATGRRLCDDPALESSRFFAAA